MLMMPAARFAIRPKAAPIAIVALHRLNAGYRRFKSKITCEPVLGRHAQVIVKVEIDPTIRWSGRFIAPAAATISFRRMAFNMIFHPEQFSRDQTTPDEIATARP